MLPDKVDMAARVLEMQAAARRIFDLDPKPVPNPRGTAKPAIACCEANSGFCIGRANVTVIRHVARVSVWLCFSGVLGWPPRWNFELLMSVVLGLSCFARHVALQPPLAG